MPRDPIFDAYVMKIHAVLDRLDYYRLLGVDKGTGASAVKKAFFGIAGKFHPDRNRDADEATRQAIYDIYKRLNEAYRVLSNPQKRTEYDAGLAQGKARLEQEDRRSKAKLSPVDTIKSRDARKFYVQAKQELTAGQLMQAELHAKLAKGREGAHDLIDTLIAEIAAARNAGKK